MKHIAFVSLFICLLLGECLPQQPEHSDVGAEDSTALADSGLDADGRFRDTAWFWVGYIEAMTEALQVDKLVCLPSHTTRREGQLVVMKYIKDNPTTLHETAYMTVMMAISKTYPCKK
jgi:hypothetical protein